MKTLEVPITIDIRCSGLGSEDITDQIRTAVIATAHAKGFDLGSIGVLITDDQTIHEINRSHLQHDYATDVISFAYEQQPPRIEGELVASLDTAAREAAELGWPVLNELLLYVVHGVLHICGMDDQSAESRRQMRIVEQQVLSSLGIPNASDYDPDDCDPDVPLDEAARHHVEPYSSIHNS